MSLVRLCYASRATFKPYTIDGMDRHVAEILAQSRRNNQRRNLVGALYYANGIFFQCLEGEEADIDALLVALGEDDRHKDLKILSRTPIRERAFRDWEMKFAMLDREIRQFLRDHGLGKFDPYRFSDAMTGELVDVLLAARDVQEDELLSVIGHPVVAARPSSPVTLLMLMCAVLAISLAAVLLNR